jgi:hypothetical protein
MVVAMHNHSNLKDPNEFATPESFAAAMKLSKYFKVNLDIGHFTAANFDAVAYIREHHASITNLHIKDRKKNQGENMPWGQGETPIREVLQLLKQNKYPIAAFLEYEYKGAGTPVDEAERITLTPSGVSGSSMSSPSLRRPKARRERRPMRLAFPRRTEATRRSPPIQACMSSTTRLPTTCTFPSSWRPCPIASTWCRTSRWRPTPRTRDRF